MFSNPYFDVLAIIVLASIILVYVSSHVYELFSSLMDTKTRCFSCERQYSEDLAWMGQPTKCFSCETDLVGRGMSGFDAHAVKFF